MKVNWYDLFTQVSILTFNDKITFGISIWKWHFEDVLFHILCIPASELEGMTLHMECHKEWLQYTAPVQGQWQDMSHTQPCSSGIPTGRKKCSWKDEVKPAHVPNLSWKHSVQNCHAYLHSMSSSFVLLKPQTKATVTQFIRQKSFQHNFTPLSGDSYSLKTKYLVVEKVI